MLFKFLQRPITVDCFTADQMAYEYFKIEKSTRYFPEWFKKIPNSAEYTNQNQIRMQFPTMKRCYGFLELYKNSFTVPMWTDTKISINPKLKTFAFQTANKNNNIHSHVREQYAGLFNETNFMQFKIETPWILKEKTGIQFMYESMFWNQARAFDYAQLPGMLEFKYNSDISIQIVVNLENKEDQIDLKLLAGTPMSMLIPLTEKRVTFKHHLVDIEEYKKLYSKDFRSVFDCFDDEVDMHKRIKALEKSKCPFSS